MSRPRPAQAPRHTSLAAAVGGILLTLSVLFHPEEAFDASWHGLRLWFDVVLPALLPFFIMADVLMGIGVIHFLGVLLEPLMRPLFRIPGPGAFALCMGLASGFPLGAKMTGDLRRNGLCSREEAERLVSLANTTDPLFLTGAVAVGMFENAALGAVLSAAHYSAVLTVGFIMRFHAGGRMGGHAHGSKKAAGSSRRNILGRAFEALIQARRSDGRPIGEIFSDAVRNTLSSMLFIGGCIMMFSVFIRMLTITGVLRPVSAMAAAVLPVFGLDPDVALALVQGAFEVTLGTLTASAAEAPLDHRVTAAGMIIAWSGLSVHVQVAAMLHGTDVRLAPYVCARLMHAVLAGAATAFLYPHMMAAFPAAAAELAAGASLWSQWAAGAWRLAGALGLLFAAAASVHLCRLGLNRCHVLFVRRP